MSGQAIAFLELLWYGLLWSTYYLTWALSVSSWERFIGLLVYVVLNYLLFLSVRQNDPSDSDPVGVALVIGPIATAAIGTVVAQTGLGLVMLLVFPLWVIVASWITPCALAKDNDLETYYVPVFPFLIPFVERLKKRGA